MKKIILIFIVFFCDKLYAQQYYDIVYLPGSSQESSTSSYKNKSMPDWYKNYEKYWFYRYRLVNDFMLVGDFPGGSIPAQVRKLKSHDDNWNDYWANDKQSLMWGDPGIDLGTYMQTLATEYKILKNNNWPTTRTEYELSMALTAFDRLDQYAESYCLGMSTGAATGYPGQVPVAPSYDKNGFFIRDDVPYNEFITDHSSHFNRKGLVPYGESDPHFINAAHGCFEHRDGFGWHYTFSWWTFARSILGDNAPMYPTEETSDQIPDLFLGMGLAAKYLSSRYDLQLQAVDAAHGIINYIGGGNRNPDHYQSETTGYFIKNPLTGHLIYGLDPKEYNSFKGIGGNGAAFLANAVPAVNAGARITTPFGFDLTTYRSYWGQGVYPEYMASFGDLYQRWVPQIKGVHADYSYQWVMWLDTYAAIANDWHSSEGIQYNTTWKTILKHSKYNEWNTPNLPLVWNLYNGFYIDPDNKDDYDYKGFLNRAPGCGPYNYIVGDKGTYTKDNGETHNKWESSFPPSDNGGGKYKDFANPHRLGEPYHRARSTFDANDYYEPDNSDYNGLDYMIMFNLYSLVGEQPSSFAEYFLNKYTHHLDYLGGIINPYWTEHFDVNYPDNNGYGSSINKLKLNWLEYLSAENTINYNGSVTYRGAKTIELLPGFKTESGAVFTAYIQDYSCDETPFNFASCTSPPSMNRLTEDTTEPISSYIPEDLPLADTTGMYLPNDTLTAEQQHIFDSVIDAMTRHFNDTDSVAADISYLEGLGILPPRDTTYHEMGRKKSLQTEHLVINRINVTLYPNPTDGKSYLEYSLSESSTVAITLSNALGQDVSYAVEQYNKNAPPGNYKLTIHSDGLAPGIYYCTIKIGNDVVTKRLNIVKSK